MFPKKILAVLGLFLIGASCFGAGSGYQPRTGEVLEYKVIVKSMIHGANQTIKITSQDTKNGRDVLNIQSTMYTIGAINQITNYSEREDLVLDNEGFFPWSLRREVHDGKKVLVEEVSFDYAHKVAIRLYSKNGAPAERSVIDLPGYVQDGLSLQFYLRKVRLNPGEYRVHFYSNGSVEDTSYQISQVDDSLKLDCGVFNNYYQVYHNQSNITIFLANNREQLPLIIRKNASFGKIEAKLVKFH